MAWRPTVLRALGALVCRLEAAEHKASGKMLSNMAFLLIMESRSSCGSYFHDMNTSTASLLSGRRFAIPS